MAAKLEVVSEFGLQLDGLAAGLVFVPVSVSVSVSARVAGPSGPGTY